MPGWELSNEAFMVRLDAFDSQSDDVVLSFSPKALGMRDPRSDTLAKPLDLGAT
jgi:hypothetical protein